MKQNLHGRKPSRSYSLLVNGQTAAQNVALAVARTEFAIWCAEVLNPRSRWAGCIVEITEHAQVIESNNGAMLELDKAPTREEVNA